MSAAAETPSPLIPIIDLLTSTFSKIEHGFNSIPGSPIVIRYIKSSYQNDPYRSLLELFLVFFALWTLFSRRTRAEGSSMNWVELTEKEIDELVDEWQPAPLIDAPANKYEEDILLKLPTIEGPNSHKPKLASTGKSVLNIASPNWIGLLNDDRIKTVAVDTLREYGLSPCGPPGFYGTLDVHTQLENDLAKFLGVEAAIIYSQSFSTISSVIPAFAKRGDTVVADRNVNFAIQKGLQIARCTVKWYDHNDMEDLERQLQMVESEAKRKGGPLKRRFIISEGIFENDGALLDLAKVIELKKKHKFRLILDETYSFGMIGKTGKGMTEYCGVSPSDVDILVGSMAVGLNAGGGFCAGSDEVTSHQRINGAAFVFSAAMPGLLATSGSAAIDIMNQTPQVFVQLAENVRTFRAGLAKLEDVTIVIPSHPASALIHIFMLSPPESIELEEVMLQEVVDDALDHGVLITRSARLRGQEQIEPAPSLKIMISAAFTKKEIEKAASVVRSSLTKVFGKKR